jgi:hypothetical protein
MVEKGVHAVPTLRNRVVIFFQTLEYFEKKPVDLVYIYSVLLKYGMLYKDKEKTMKSSEITSHGVKITDQSKGVRQRNLKL